MTTTAATPAVLPTDDAATYAEWFARLAEPTRVRLRHAVATSGRTMTVGELTELLGISQSTCSHHVRKLALHHSAGFRTLGVRERIAQPHGVWRDTVFLERRATS